jgi:hypothetical protein
MSNNLNQKSSKRNQPRKTKQNGNILTTYTPTYSQNIMPHNKYAKLVYNDGSTVRNNPGGNFLVYSMRINDLYDPDPALLSGSVSNFKEMMQFYSYYKVSFSDITWNIVNLENFPLSCGVVYTQTNLTGTIATLADAQNALENDFATQVYTISAKGGLDRTKVTVNKFSIHNLLGNASQYEGDVNYSGLGLATPSIPLWVNFIVWAPTGAVLANGYANSTRIAFYSRFYGRVNNRS